MTAPAKLELVAPAGTMAAFKAAVEAGADAVYVGFRDETNARNFPGLNFDRAEMAEAASLAHRRGVKLFVAINTYPAAGRSEPWRRAIDAAAGLGADAVILADIGLLDYAATRHPGLRRHLSVQASASTPEAIRFYGEAFGVRRVVLPRVLTLAEIAALVAEAPVETEVFAYGGLCVMAEGRCLLSSYATGQSPNLNGVCSPAEEVRYRRDGTRMISRLGRFAINAVPAGEPAGYPTLCKGRFSAGDAAPAYLFEEPTSLNVAMLLPELMAAGVRALKIEGRQRGRAYVAAVVAAFRRAIDAAAAGRPLPATDLARRLAAVSEGGRETAGAYRKDWR
jgi:collagenase-like PrtC family protease